MIHKLFKVLVPRYINYCESFTQMYLLPIDVKSSLDPKGGRTSHYQKALIELKGINLLSYHLFINKNYLSYSSTKRIINCNLQMIL